MQKFVEQWRYMFLSFDIWEDTTVVFIKSQLYYTRIGNIWKTKKSCIPYSQRDYLYLNIVGREINQ